MPDSLSGKVAAVTGAASGIGYACARAMLEAGARVVLIDLAEDRLQSLCAELGRTPSRSSPTFSIRPASPA
jgi:ribitol 2-dehydrogenase